MASKKDNKFCFDLHVYHICCILSQGNKTILICFFTLFRYSPEKLSFEKFFEFTVVELSIAVLVKLLQHCGDLQRSELHKNKKAKALDSGANLYWKFYIKNI